MVDQVITKQELIDAKRDARDLGKAVNEKVIVSPRYGEDFKSLPMIAAEFQISSDAAEAAAISAAGSADIAQNSANIAQNSANIAEAAATSATIGAGVFETPEAGVDPVTGVADGAYFNVRSSSDESYVDEYQNVGGVPTPSGKSYPSAAALDGVGEKLDREFLSVWDFFTAQELASYKAAPTTFDAYSPIQEFFNYIRDNDVGTAYCSGNFRVSAGIIFGGSVGSKTKMVSGYFYITALNAIDTMMTVQAGQQFIWQGSITTVGTGSTSYSSRTCRVGIKWGGAYNSSRNVVTNLVASRFSQVGVSCNNSTTLTNFGDIKVADCGSGNELSGYSLTANFSNRVDSGSSGSSSQKSKITVDVLPPELSETQLFLVISGQPYIITEVDRINSTLTVFPWIDLAITTGSLRYLFGGGVYTFGGDSSVNKISKIDATRCSFAFLTTALYPPVVDSVVAQYCGAAVGIGGTGASASVAGYIGELYCEANQFDFIRISRATLGFKIGVIGPFNVNRVATTTLSRLGNNTFPNNAILESIIFGGYNGYSLTAEVPLTVSNNIGIDVSDKDRSEIRSFHQNPVCVLQAPSKLLKLFGYDLKKVVVFGTSSATNYTPTTVTFNAPAGYTVNGLTSIVFGSFDGPVEFIVTLREATSDFIVTSVSKALKQATTTYDPPSLAAGARDTVQTMTVTGAALGDNVNMSFNKDLQGVSLIGYVSAANTVSYYFENRSSATVDLVSGTVKAKIV